MKFRDQATMNSPGAFRLLLLPLFDISLRTKRSKQMHKERERKTTFHQIRKSLNSKKETTDLSRGLVARAPEGDSQEWIVKILDSHNLCHPYASKVNNNDYATGLDSEYR